MFLDSYTPASSSVLSESLKSGCLWFVSTFIIFNSSQTFAEDCRRYHSAVWENDAIAFDDAGYSNGFMYNWGYPSESCATEWAQTLAGWLTTVHQLSGQQRKDETTSISYQLASAVFTPTNIEIFELIPNDRPYVGLFYGSVSVHFYNDDATTHYTLLAGAAGPITMTEQTQQFIHLIIGARNPNGWNNQIENEMVVQAGAEKSWRLFSSGQIIQGYETDIISMTDIKAGNLSSDIGAGLSFRIGNGLQRSFAFHDITAGRNLPSMSLRPGDWGAFASLYTNYVFNDLSIDGNTFKNSHSVLLQHTQWRYAFGGYYQFSRYGFTASIQESSDQFEGSKENTLYLTMALSY